MEFQPTSHPCLLVSVCVCVCLSVCVRVSVCDDPNAAPCNALGFSHQHLHERSCMLTNQFTSAWTHYTGTIRGTRTDHMVG